MLGGYMAVEEDVVVESGIPGDVPVLSELMENDPEMAKEIVYLMGGVESFRNVNRSTRFPLSISVEEGNYNIKAVIEKIIGYLVSLLEDIFSGSTAGALAVEGVVSRAENTLLNSRTARRNHQKNEFIIDTRIQNLSVRYRPISDPQQLLIQLRILNGVVKAVFTYLTHSVFSGFNDLIAFDPTRDNLDDLANKLVSSAPSVLKGDSKFINNGFTINSPQLLGNQQIVINNRRPDAHALESILACNMALQTAEEQPREIADNIEYRKFGVSLEQSIIREVIDIATTLSNYNTLNRRTIRRNRLKLITQRLNNLNTTVDSGEATEETILNIRNYIRVLEVYSGWVSSPYVGLIALVHRNLTAVLNVCEGNAK